MSNPRNKIRYQDLLPIIFYHFIIKINYKIHLLVHVFHCLWNTFFMYVYFVLLYDYITLHLIVTDSGTWIRVWEYMLIFHFDLLWPSVPECPVTVKLARQPLQLKVIQSPQIHILQTYKKKCLQMRYVWYSKPNINLQRERVLSYKRFTRYLCTKCNNIFQQLDKCC